MYNSGKEAQKQRRSSDKTAMQPLVPQGVQAERGGGYARSCGQEGGFPMSEDFGPTFLTVTDDDGNEIVLEFIDALEYQGNLYQAFFPAETEDENGEIVDADSGLVILKVIHENGEDLLSTLDSDEELEAVYDLFMEELYEDG